MTAEEYQVAETKKSCYFNRKGKQEKRGKIMEQPKNNFRSILMFFVRIGLAAGIIGALVVTQKESFCKVLPLIDYRFFIPAMLAIYIQYIGCSYRWYRLSRVLGIRLTFMESLSLSMQSFFLSLVIPGGSIGGDVAKVGFLAARAPKGSRFEGALTVLMDRVVGMVALFSLAIVVILCEIPLLMNLSHPAFEVTRNMRIAFIVLLLGVCFAGLAASAVLFCYRPLEKIAFFRFFFQKGDKITHGAVTRFAAAFDCYKKSFGLLSYLTLFSIVVIQLILLPAIYFITRAVGLPGIPLSVLLCAVIIGDIAGLIPLTPSGLGLRDTAICAILMSAGVADPAVIPVLFSCTLILVNLSGVIFFLIDPTRQKGISVAAKEEADHA